jgi:hypothetical protein
MPLRGSGSVSSGWRELGMGQAYVGYLDLPTLSLELKPTICIVRIGVF